MKSIPAADIQRASHLSAAIRRTGPRNVGSRRARKVKPPSNDDQ